MTVLLGTGLRVGGLLALRLRDVNQNQIHVRRLERVTVRQDDCTRQLRVEELQTLVALTEGRRERRATWDH